MLDTIHFGDIHLSNVSVFESNNYDVLKMDAVGDGLEKAHQLLSKLPNSNEFTDYRPHMTIAYLEKEMWQSYTNRMRDLQFRVTPIFAIYSIPSGKKFKLKIK
jgi:2'-5' RNA ligase